MPEAVAQQPTFAKLVSLFLSEELKSRRVSLARAAEISRRVLKKLGSITSETEALNMLSEIEKDFEEISVLKQALHFGQQQSDIKFYEREIKEYASELLKQDMQVSASFLRDCSTKNCTIETLCLKYPQFSEYMTHVLSSRNIAQLAQPTVQLQM